MSLWRTATSGLFTFFFLPNVPMKPNSTWLGSCTEKRTKMLFFLEVEIFFTTFSSRANQSSVPPIHSNLPPDIPPVWAWSNPETFHTSTVARGTKPLYKARSCSRIQRSESVETDWKPPKWLRCCPRRRLGANWTFLLKKIQMKHSQT